MDKHEQKSEALLKRLVEMLGSKRFDNLQNLLSAATCSSGSNVRLEDLSDLSRSSCAALRRGLAGRSLAKEYQKWQEERPLKKTWVDSLLACDNRLILVYQQLERVPQGEWTPSVTVSQCSEAR